MTDLRGKRILIVEDEPIVAMAAEDMLLDLGCHVVGPAHSLDRALALIESETLDAAILDINLNGERSYSVAAKLASLNVPYAFATGYAPDHFDCDLSAAIVLEKPYSRAQLEALLHQIL
ncbi:MAG: response regulator [Allopontixanthobacter sediminis]